MAAKITDTKGTKGQETLARIAQAAESLFDEKGYYGTGINEILAKAKAPRGSLYFHFPGGKDEIAAYVLHSAGEKIGALLRAGLQQADGPEAAIRAMVAFFKLQLTESEFKCGCPVSTVGLELSGSGSPVLDACAGVYRDWMGVLQNYLKGFTDDHARAEQVAKSVFCLIEGALLVSRVTGDLSIMEQAEAQSIALVEALTPD